MAAKQCTKCGITKPLSDFYKRSDRPSGKHSRCAECFRAEHKTWRIANKKRRAADMAAWRLKNPGRSAVFHKKWQANNLDKCRANNARRHAAKLRAVPAWAELDKIATVYAKAKQYGFTVDHVVPLQHPLVCGLHVWHNLQLLDESENAKKKNYHWPDMP
jgi:hypothetical protein